MSLLVLIARSRSWIAAARVFLVVFALLVLLAYGTSIESTEAFGYLFWVTLACGGLALLVAVTRAIVDLAGGRGPRR